VADVVIGAKGAAPTAPVVVTTSYRRYALTLLVVIYTVNFLDRSIVTQLIEPIKEDLHLNDTEVGAMAGWVFGLFYTVLGVFMGRWADRGDRPVIMTLALTVWSGFTVLGGFAQNFATLVVSRLGVGIGEAGCSPTAHSLISEYTPREKRASALAIYAMGTPIGTMLGMILGALIADRYGWRTAFFVAGAPGLVMAAIALATLKEPRRALKSAAAKAADAAQQIPVVRVIRTLAAKPTFWTFSIASGSIAFIGYAHATFLASFFLRNHTPELASLAAQFGMQPRGFVGTAMGLMAGIGGVLGSFVGGWLSDRFSVRDLRWSGTFPAIAPLISTPVFWFILSTSNMALALPLLLIPYAALAMWYGPVYGGVQGLVPVRMRAIAAAVLLFIINILGAVAGPSVFGWFNDLMTNRYLGGTGLDVEACKTALGAAKASCAAASAHGIKTTMYLSTIMIAPAVLGFWASRWTIRQDMES
jgi:MFS family permease